MAPLPTVHVIGVGLIGGSIALSLGAQGCTVTVEDINGEHLAMAGRLGLHVRSELGDDSYKDPDHVFVCVPPNVAAQVLAQTCSRYPRATITDVTSVKGAILPLAFESGADPHRVVSAHPMAGREISGPSAARADLFDDRVWIITATPANDPQRVESLKVLITAMGSSSINMSVEQHDRVVALVSHTPQILSSIMAGSLSQSSMEELSVSGSGLADMIRIAGSDPELWREILISNSTEVVSVLDSLITSLDVARAAIRAQDKEAVTAFLSNGNSGKMRVPGKHGGKSTQFDSINIKISDKPGALAELFAAAGRLDVNLEDVRIEHILGRPSGIVQLFVRPGEIDALESGLEGQGFETRGRG